MHHKAEELLVKKSPIIPLFCNVDIYASRDLSNIKQDDFGGKNFTKVKQKNYEKYLPEEEEPAVLPATTDGSETDENAE